MSSVDCVNPANLLQSLKQPGVVGRVMLVDGQDSLDVPVLLLKARPVLFRQRVPGQPSSLPLAGSVSKSTSRAAAALSSCIRMADSIAPL